MAKISISFTDTASNITDTYDTTLTDAALNRMIDAARNVYGVKGPTPGQPVDPLTKNQAKKRLVRQTISDWKDIVNAYEKKVASDTAIAAVTNIDTVEA